MLMVDYMEVTKMHNAYVRELEDKGPRIFNVILQHCPSTVILKIKGQPGYEACKDARDPVELLLVLRDITHKHDATKNETMAIVKSNVELYLGHQGKTNSTNKHYRLLKSRVDTITAYRGTPVHHPAQAKRILERELKKDGHTKINMEHGKGSI